MASEIFEWLGIKGILLLLVGCFVGYYINNAICKDDISKLTPGQYKILLKSTKEELKNNKIYENLIKTSLATYCINPKTNIVKYYRTGELINSKFGEIKELNCIYDFQMKEIFNLIYNDDKSKIIKFMENKVKGFSDK